MSAFFVSDKCLDKCVTAILQYVDTPFNGLPVVEANASVIGTALREMNAEALRQRYDDKFTEDQLVYEFSSGQAEPAVLLKALHCLHYQCAEGNVPETNPLFKLIAKVSRTIEATGVSARSAVYEAAPWGD